MPAPYPFRTHRYSVQRKNTSYGVSTPIPPPRPPLPPAPNFSPSPTLPLSHSLHYSVLRILSFPSLPYSVATDTLPTSPLGSFKQTSLQRAVKAQHSRRCVLPSPRANRLFHFEAQLILFDFTIHDSLSPQLNLNSPLLAVDDIAVSFQPHSLLSKY